MLLELSLLGGVLRVLLIIELTTDLGKSFHEANFLMVLISAERTLHERCDEHAWNDKDSAVFNHLNEFNGAQHMFDIGKLTPSLFTNNLIDHELDLRSTRINLVQMNTQITDRHKNWNILLFKEAIKIKKPKHH